MSNAIAQFESSARLHQTPVFEQIHRHASIRQYKPDRNYSEVLDRMNKIKQNAEKFWFFFILSKTSE